MSERPIMPNDTVLHKPSGEKWVVAGVNHATGELCPMGYPFPSVAKIADCEIIEKGYEAEFQSEEIIKAFRDRGMLNFIDIRSAIYLGILLDGGRV